jgi:hypothetical protein
VGATNHGVGSGARAIQFVVTGAGWRDQAGWQVTLAVEATLASVTTTSGHAPAGNEARPRAVDSACAQAVDLAREALVGVADPSSVGEHLDVVADGERLATHLFDSLLPGYVGWRWAVTVTRAARARHVTVDDVVLLPGPESLLAPPWVPWNERLRPGDLGVGDLLPPDADDDRLEPGWNGQSPEHDVLVAFTARDDVADWVDLVGGLDLTRSRVLSPIGLDDAIDRWMYGENGPSSPLAEAAPGPCATCGFRVALSGRLGQAFGICANVFSPSDGRVVALGHGCGAHSGSPQEPGHG